MSNTKTFTTINPTTEEEIKTYQAMTWEQTSSAINYCHTVFEQWRMKSLEDRAKIISAIGKELDKNTDELAELMTKEMGKLLKHGKQEVQSCVAIFNWTAENGPKELK